MLFQGSALSSRDSHLPALSLGPGCSTPILGTPCPAPLLQVDASSLLPGTQCLLGPVAFITLDCNRLSSPLFPFPDCKFLQGGTLTYLRVLTEHERSARPDARLRETGFLWSKWSSRESSLVPVALVIEHTPPPQFVCNYSL